jgi:WD40 repeat protein
VAVYGDDQGIIRTADIALGTPLGVSLPGHSASITAVTVSDLDGRAVIVSGSRDCRIRVWDLAECTLLRDIPTDHKHTINALAVGAVGERQILISSDPDGILCRWDLASGTQIGAPLTGHTASVRSVTVGVLAGRTVAISGSHDSTIRIWDLEQGIPVGRPLTGHEGFVFSVAFGEQAGQPLVISGGNDGTIRRWDIAEGKAIGEPWQDSPLGWRVTSVAIGALGNRQVVVSGNQDRSVRIRCLESGDAIGPPLIGHYRGPVESVAVGSLEGKPVVVSGGDDGTVRAWDVSLYDVSQYLVPDTGAFAFEDLLPTVEPRAVALGARAGRPVIHAMIGDGSCAAVGIWDLADGALLDPPLSWYEWPYAYSGAAVGEIAEGTVFVTCNDELKTVEAWDMLAGKQIGDSIPTSIGAARVAISEFANRPVLAYTSGTNIQVWEIKSGTLLESINTGDGLVTALRIGSIAGKTAILFGKRDGTIQVWDLAEKAPLCPEVHTEEEYLWAVDVGVLNGRPIIVTGGAAGKVGLWTWENRKISEIDIAANIISLALGPDATLAVATELGLMALRLY